MLPLDCAPFTSFSFILSKSRCPVLTAGLRIYLTKEYCMFNNEKKKKHTHEKTKKKRRKCRKKKREMEKIEGGGWGVIYILKLHAQGWESHI